MPGLLDWAFLFCIDGKIDKNKIVAMRRKTAREDAGKRRIRAEQC